MRNPFERLLRGRRQRSGDLCSAGKHSRTSYDHGWGFVKCHVSKLRSAAQDGCYLCTFILDCVTAFAADQLYDQSIVSFQAPPGYVGLHAPLDESDEKYQSFSIFRLTGKYPASTAVVL